MIRSSISALLWLGLVHGVWAADTGSDHHKTRSLLPAAYQRIAQRYQIDGIALYALAHTESGKRAATGTVMPWPWTTNICDGAPGVRCKGYWFETRDALYSRLRQELERGNEWFDVGQTQMNWHYHKHRFGHDLWVATHPLVNLNQAAGLVAELSAKQTNLVDVFAAYHAGSAWKSRTLSEHRQRQIRAYAHKTAAYYQSLQKGVDDETPSSLPR